MSFLLCGLWCSNFLIRQINTSRLMKISFSHNFFSPNLDRPHYLENILYARRWMTKFLLALLTQRDVSTLESPPCQHVVKEETESLLRTFLAKESNDSSSAIEMRNISKMISDILECFNTLDDDKIAVSKGWLSPVLSACIQTNNVTIRTSVQILLTRLLKGGGGNIIQQRSGSVANGDVPSQDDS